MRLAGSKRISGHANDPGLANTCDPKSVPLSLVPLSRSAFLDPRPLTPELLNPEPCKHLYPPSQSSRPRHATVASLPEKSGSLALKAVPNFFLSFFYEFLDIADNDSEICKLQRNWAFAFYAFSA